MSDSDGVERVSAKDAAVKVLHRADGPLKVDEIAKRVLKTDGVKLGGKTPEATIAALLAVENKKPDGLFVRVEKGTYDLRERSAAPEPAEAKDETKDVAEGAEDAKPDPKPSAKKRPKREAVGAAS